MNTSCWGGWLRRGIAGTAILALAGAVAAQQDQQGVQRRAVRLSSVDGQVTLSQGGTLITDHALANLPIFEGTQVVTGDDGRAELQFDDGSVARIPPDSSLTLAKLDPSGDSTIVLDSGMGYFELQGASGQPAMHVRFDDTVVTANGFTVMRVRMDQPPGELAVFQGDANLNEGDGNVQVDVRSGESLTLGASDPAQYNLAETIAPDSWDQWNSDRDQALSAEEGDQTPATQSMADNNNPAWGDLNQNGTWYNTPDQGYVWSPYEASDEGWDPYGMGYWVDEPAYGYVWVSGEPWGYMPYQCGAWNYYSSFGWGWAPGMCRPWWGGGGWGYNIGNAPIWYRRPVRPNPPRGHGAGTQKLIPGNGGKPPIGLRPIIAVNRHAPPPTHTILPPRDRNTPVALGGTVVAPLRPVARTRITAPIVPYRAQGPAAPVSRRPVYTPPARNPYRGAETWPTNRQGYTPTVPVYPNPRPGEPRTGSAPVYRPPANNGGSRPAPAPAPRSSPPPAAPRAAPSPHAFWHPSSWFAPHSSSAASSHERSYARSSSGHSSGHSGGGSHGGGSSHGGGGGSHGGGGHR